MAEIQDAYKLLSPMLGIPMASVLFAFALLASGQNSTLTGTLAGPNLERAIGVLYIPRTERQSHYFYTRLPEQFDYVIHIDETRAVEPLERSAGWETGEVAETYPSGL